MKASVLFAPHTPLKLEDVELEPPRAGEVRVRMVDLPRLVDLYRGGRLKIDELITKRYGLDEANEAFRALAAGELSRGLIVF